MGLYQKYRIEKTDGTVDPNAKYIVLRYDAQSKDPEARTALLHYCQSHRDSSGAFEDPFFKELWDDVIAESKASRQTRENSIDQYDRT